MAMKKGTRKSRLSDLVPELYIPGLHDLHEAVDLSLIHISEPTRPY